MSFIDSEVFAQQAAGSSSAEAAQVRRVLGELTELANSGAHLQAGRDRLADFRDEGWFARITAAGFELNDATWSQLRVWGRYDPASDLRRCTVPTLALFGAEDSLVPVQDSITAYERTAKLAERDHASRTFPHVGHRMTAPGSDQLAPEYLDAVCRYVGRDV